MNIDVYCDEAYPDLFSSQKPQAQYLVIGSLWLQSQDRESYKEAIHALRDRFHIGGEFKWTKVSPSKLDFYLALISWFYEQGNNLRFRCVAVDRTQVDLLKFHENDQELGFYKRMDLIKTALEYPDSESYVGWDSRRKRYDRNRRVAIVMKNYVVIIGLKKQSPGFFITALVADSSRTLSLIR